MNGSITLRKSRAFSLIELVIVVVIIGIIGAIAIPRMSRGAEGANDSALKGNLAVLRNAIELYATEHNGDFPTAADFDDQLLNYTDIDGDDSATKDATHVYGPYLREIPYLNVGSEKGNNAVAAAAGAGVAWIYDEDTGVISANTGTDVDASGTLYSDY